ncbi:hypothetical protein ES677_11220 [Bizionia gelidisalsuginis]|uniref:Threonine synthase n=2 Tax=Bizionia TaxID=283785 RepID=A0A8H2QKG2_9FLAO|nr:MULTISPECIES: DUF6503 family protein [Bizionia]TYB70486.1 hypothetical protein ES676_13215 [Bizionia saleffrena]TYC10634.1 hypothetical protein ES677_11220 [Bizionia gelidisalsuginis]
MKNYLGIVLLMMTFMGCKQKETAPEKVQPTPEVEIKEDKSFPEDIAKVFEAHGGLDHWKTMQSVEFTMRKPGGDEVTRTNLNSRESLIEAENYVIGFDGEAVWFLNRTEEEYKGYAPKFYYNLMFYFYAMPFVLADDGIVFSAAKAIEFEGVTYPGIKIAYENGVGESPDDEYVLYYHPETFKMEWLGYTVTYFSKEKTKEFHLKKYNKWEEVEGVLLPTEMVNYEFFNNQPINPVRTTAIFNAKLSKEALDVTRFSKPENATFVE